MLFLKGDDYPQNVAWDWGGSEGRETTIFGIETPEIEICMLPTEVFIFFQ